LELGGWQEERRSGRGAGWHRVGGRRSTGRQRDLAHCGRERGRGTGRRGGGAAGGRAGCVWGEGGRLVPADGTEQSRRVALGGPSLATRAAVGRRAGASIVSSSPRHASRSTVGGVARGTMPLLRVGLCVRSWARGGRESDGRQGADSSQRWVCVRTWGVWGAGLLREIDRYDGVCVLRTAVCGAERGSCARSRAGLSTVRETDIGEGRRGCVRSGVPIRYYVVLARPGLSRRETRTRERSHASTQSERRQRDRASLLF